MAADAYISMAVSQLRSAVSELHSEIQTIQHDTYDQQQHLQGDITQTEYNAANVSTEIRAKQALHEDDHRQELQSRLSQLQTQINQKKQDINKKGSDAANIVQQKTALMNRLQSLASQLEPLISQAR